MKVILALVVGLFCATLGPMGVLVAATAVRHVSIYQMSDPLVWALVALQALGGSWLTVMAMFGVDRRL